MTEITLIFPDQLFQNHPAIAPGRTIYLAEEFLFFKVQPFHRQRLVLLRAAMREYAQSLLKAKNDLIYLPAKELNERGELFKTLAKKGVKCIHLAEFADEWLQQDLYSAADKYGWTIRFYPSPGFLCTNRDIKAFFAEKENYSMAQFYTYQRKRFNILMDGGTPLGGKYSFDIQNRKKIPKGIGIPPPFYPRKNQEINTIIDEVDREFTNAIGKAKPYIYAVTHDEAQHALRDFLKFKLVDFGPYQDAIQHDDSFLFHSVLSAYLNTGLLTPKEVVKATLMHAEEKEIPLNSLEGFIRQIIGWREFVRASYIMKGSSQRSLNYFHHHQKIPKSFWKGTTGIQPIDTTIQRILHTGYCNHIERLMVLGNFLILTETDPHQVYEWFTANFIDAYDWVMVPNVYGMSQYADGGKIVTKPYISASNYILKMSDFKKNEWSEIWDGLFWRFMHLHERTFSTNHRTGTLIQLFEKNKSTILPKIHKAESWLKDYRKE